MRRSFASIPKVHVLLVGAMLGIVLNCLVAEVAFPAPNETVSVELATPAVPSCEPGDILLDQPDRASPIEFPCPSDREAFGGDHRGPCLSHSYGPARIHHGAARAGTCDRTAPSGIRRPTCKCGSGGATGRFGFRRRFLCLSTACIRHRGIRHTNSTRFIPTGSPSICTASATRHAGNPALARHCRPARRRLPLRAGQSGRMESLPADARQNHPGRNPLRETVTAQGPISLEDMFVGGTSLIAAAPTAEPPAHAFKPQQRVAAPRIESPSARQAGKKAAHDARALRARRTALKVVPPRYPQLVRPQPIYMEEGRRNQRGIGVVAVVLPSTSRSAVRAR